MPNFGSFNSRSFVLWLHSEKFYPIQYIPLLCDEMMRVLRNQHEALASSKDIHLEFISRMIGKVCVSGHSGLLMHKSVMQEISNTLTY